MSARKGQPNAVLEQVAQIPLVLSAVSALRDTKVMGKIAYVMTGIVEMDSHAVVSIKLATEAL